VAVDAHRHSSRNGAAGIHFIGKGLRSQQVAPRDYHLVIGGCDQFP
jgi:hypothetical protein